MKKINKQIIPYVSWIFLFAALGLKGQAYGESSSMILEQVKLQRMIADSGTSQNLTHKVWDKRNPFNTFGLKKTPEFKKTVQRTNFVLEGIFFGSSMPSAIINGKVVGIGNVIAGATVLDIKINSVTLIDEQGTRKVLSLEF